MAHLDELLDAVTENSNKTSSIIALVNGLADRLEKSHTDPEVIARIVAELHFKSTDIPAAIYANTNDTSEN